MKSVIISSILIFGCLSVFASINPQQLKSFQMMQLNNQIIQTENELNEKVISQKTLKGSLKEVESTMSLTRTFGMKSKLEKLKKDQSRIKNEIQQLDVDISQLKLVKNNLIKNQKEMNK